MLDGSVGQQQSMSEINREPVLRCSFRRLHHKNPVVRMGALKNQRNRWLQSWIEFENTIRFLRPYDFSTFDPPTKAAGQAEPLRFSQISLAATQGLFGPLSVFDVDICSVPFHNFPFRVAQWLRPDKETSIFSVRSPQACFHLRRFARCHDLPPFFSQTGKVIR